MGLIRSSKVMIAIQRKRESYVVEKCFVVKERRRESGRREVEVELRGGCRGGYNKHTSHSLGGFFDVVLQSQGRQGRETCQ